MKQHIKAVRTVLLLAALTIVGAVGGMIARVQWPNTPVEDAGRVSVAKSDVARQSPTEIKDSAESTDEPFQAAMTKPVGVLSNVGTQAAANALLHGDMMLREGRVSEAVRHFRRLLVDASAHATLASVQYRIALCAEALGNHEEALATYQKVAKSIPSGQLGELAILGQARVFADRHENAAAQKLLRRWLLQNNETSPGSQWIARDGVYLLGVVAAETGLNLSDAKLWEQDGLARPFAQFEPNEYLPTAESTTDNPQADAPLGVTLLHQLRESEPGSSYFQGRLARTSVHRVLQQICEATQWKLELTPAAEGSIRAQTIRLDFAEQSADVLFDLLLAPLGVAWSFADGRVKIQAENELAVQDREAYRWSFAERMLFAALLNEPEHPQAPAAYLLLGNLAFERGDLATARGHFEKVLQGYPRSDIDAEAWFNAAKVAIAEGDLPRARQTLLGAVDAGRGNPLEPVALLLSGQNALLFNEPEKAVRPLVRAVTLAANQDVRALSMLTLASAHLIAGHPEAANVALMDDRRLLRQDAYRDRAALLACMARFRAASTPERIDRDGRSLVAALCHAGAAEWTAMHDQFLTIEAYRDVGLTELAIPLLESSVDTQSPSPLRTKMQFLLAQLLQERGQSQQAQIVLTAMTQDPSPDISSRSRLALAELHLSQQEPDHAERICRDLLTSSLSEERRLSTLRLLGGIYANRGDRQRAVLCFSGVAPQLYDATLPTEVSAPIHNLPSNLGRQRTMDPLNREGPL